MDEDVQPGGRRRQRWQLGLVAVVLIALVGAVVWARHDNGGSARRAAVNAPDPAPIFAEKVQVGTTTLFLKNIQGLTIKGKVAGSGLALVRGLSSDTFFANWIKQMRDSGPTVARRNVTITFLDTALLPVRSVRVTNAVPDSLTFSPIDGTNPVLETLRLSYSDIAPG
jgi:hypothetical protein